MKYGKLILRKIIKIFATRCLILGLKCTKNRFRLGLCPRPRKGAYSAPTDLGALLLRGGEGRGKEKRGRKGKGEETRGGEEMGGKGKEGGKEKGRTTAIPNFLGPGRTIANSER